MNHYSLKKRNRIKTQNSSFVQKQLLKIVLVFKRKNQTNRQGKGQTGKRSVSNLLQKISERRQIAWCAWQNIQVQSCETALTIHNRREYSKKTLMLFASKTFIQ